MEERPIIVVGDWQHADFAAATGWLQSHADCKCYDDVSAAENELRSPSMSLDPGAILFLQSRPRQFAARDVEGLHRIAPLARLVVLVGPWCEGEHRSGRLWPGVVRVPWRAWPHRLARELGLGELSANNKPLPRTASEPERIERDTAITQRQRCSATAAVHTDSRLNYECLAALLAQLGIDAMWHTAAAAPLGRFDLEIYDGWPWGRESWAENGQGGRESFAGYSVPSQAANFRERLPTPSILLLHFPRPEDFDRARSAGIAAIVAQPLLLGDLAAAIASVLHPPTAAP